MIDAVERYRELFKVEVDGISFVECPLLLDGVYRAYGRLLKCGYDEAYAQLVVSQICLKVPNEMQLSCVMDMEFSEAICFLQRVFCDSYDLRYLYSDVNIVFKLLYVIVQYFYVSSVYCFFLLVVLLKHEDLFGCIVLFQPRWFRLLKFDSSDCTYAYLDVLKWLSSLDVPVMVYDESLLLYYPFLSREQVLFYNEHRSGGCYYTIKQYVLFNDVCYETARLHLLQLVQMGWYKKKKVGKKFVYSV